MLDGVVGITVSRHDTCPIDSPNYEPWPHSFPFYTSQESLVTPSHKKYNFYYLIYMSFLHLYLVFMNFVSWKRTYLSNESLVGQNDQLTLAHCPQKQKLKTLCHNPQFHITLAKFSNFQAVLVW